MMLHGNAVGQWLAEPTDRHRTGGASRHQVSSVNWGMFMARRRVGAGRLGLRTMLSLEPWTVSDCGVLNLLATGETCEGDGIHDRQHAHDFLMEVAADYHLPLRGTLRWQLYAGLSGEPALGPPAFPHRLSAMPLPMAPVTHHWMDSTHISFGVVTTGVYTERWKTELSLFNAREPDEYRADLDLAPLDSVAARLSYGAKHVAFQVSVGRLREAEREYSSGPRQDQDRATVSATLHRRIGEGGLWATMVAYGLTSGPVALPDRLVRITTHALLAESVATWADRHTWFGRVEVVGKPAHSLHAHEFDDAVFTVGKLAGGYTFHLRARRSLVPGIGVVASLNMLPQALAPRYAGRVAPGFGVFLSLRPTRHFM